MGIRISSGRAELYLPILAVLSVGAAYVPVDVDDPDERADLVWSTAGVCAVLGDDGALTWRGARAAGVGARRPAMEDGAWIIFTSSTTGTPKGVAVTHRSAAAFVDAEARLFLRGAPLGPETGSCLVPANRAVVKSGPELVQPGAHWGGNPARTMP